MSNLEFGFTMMVIGMGGTLAVLSLFAVLMVLLKQIFPNGENNSEELQ